jgi:hypothetical protein
LGVSFRYSFVDQTYRRFAESTGKALGLTGIYAKVRYLRDEVELGCDRGWLCRQGAGLRFEGSVSRFCIDEHDLIALPDPAACDSKAIVDVNGIAVTVAFIADAAKDRAQLAQVLRGWPKAWGQIGRKLPPTTPQPITFLASLPLAAERLTRYGLFACMSIFSRINFCPRRLRRSGTSSWRFPPWSFR